MAIDYQVDIVNALFTGSVQSDAAYQAPGTYGLPTSFGSFRLDKTSVLAAGGTGYAVRNLLTLSGGTHTSTATIQVLTVSSGIVTSFEVVNPGIYTVLPSNPISVTGGGGSGFTLTGAWKGGTDRRILTMIEILRSYITEITTLSEQKLFQAVLRRMISELRFGGPSTFTASTLATDAQVAAIKYIAAIPGESSGTL